MAGEDQQDQARLEGYRRREAVGMAAQKSAEGIVGRCSTRLKARTRVDGRTPVTFCIRKEQKMDWNIHAESKNTGRNPGRYGSVRRAGGTETESLCPKATNVMEAVVERENMFV